MARIGGMALAFATRVNRNEQQSPPVAGNAPTTEEAILSSGMIRL
jgi:hypothetical protein